MGAHSESRARPELHADAERMAIVRGLLDMGRAGMIGGVWTYRGGSDLGIRRTLGGLGPVERVSWDEAAAMVEDFKAKAKIKPIRVVKLKPEVDKSPSVGTDGRKRSRARGGA